MNNQSENKEPDFFTPNAPIKYATAGGRGCLLYTSGLMAGDIFKKIIANLISYEE